MNKAATHIWTWFLDNKAQLKILRTLAPKDQKYYTFWLDWHLHFYAPGVDHILVFPKQENDKAQLVITANGNPDHFQKVNELIKAAPKLKDWKFTAFVQPRHEYIDLAAGLDMPYIIQNISLKISELKFIPKNYEDRSKIDLVVYLNNFKIYAQNENLQLLIFIMMQDLLGEKSLHENIDLVELTQLPYHHDSEMICLYDLQFYIDSIKKKRRIKHLLNPKLQLQKKK